MSGGRTDVAVVGMACRYPGAANPRELWDNALAGRRAFRRIPPERLRLEDYSGEGPDSIYLREAALLEDWQLDRVELKIAGPSWRAADHAHWLALEVAARALDDAGRPGGEGLDRDGTGVLVGNSLTGEFSRAGQLRLRWPYVRRAVDAALAEEGRDEAQRGEFLAALEERFKAPFPEPGEETLAGGLANTIAGRIANHFDFHGGGYTVDGACASSLLAVANACSALAAGDLEVAVAGGVDLSLDPFELVGFSRTGAFARDRMRVYDARSGGFLPGEGCGMVVLTRLEDARRQGLRVHAVIRGWGLSSDGAGGLTRPSADGQLLALERAYRRAGFGAATVAYFEGHGTGTAVGDPVELAALALARRKDLARREGSPGDDAGPALPAAVGSIKAVIGHTKAAAGVAGLLKAVMALRDGILPPTIGCEEPHPVLSADGEPMLRTLDRAEPWPQEGVPRAGVSAFGFGGINAHVVMEAEVRAPLAARRSGALPERVRRLDGGRQDVELLLLSAPDRRALAERAEALAARARGLSHAELTDLAAELATAETPGRLRAFVAAGRPAEAVDRLSTLARVLRQEEGALPLLDPKGGFAAGEATRPPRLGFLFPGQGVPDRADGGAWARRFPEYDAVRRTAGVQPGSGEEAPSTAPATASSTAVAQPAIAAASLGALAVLDRLGLEAGLALGHSLGELSALAWGGSLGGESLVRLARARGAAMAAVPGEPGTMASLACGPQEAASLVAGTDAVVAGHNGPRQTVVSGPAEAVEAVVRRARQRGVGSSRLRVSHAFHSPAMEAAVPALAAALEREVPVPPARRVVSTITGAVWSPEDDAAELLLRQLTSPVRFTEALEVARGEGVDLWIEVGPGRVLGEMARRAGAAPVVSVDAGGGSLAGLLIAAGTAWVLGAPLAVEELFRDRHVKPLPATHVFLASPCESLPPLDDAAGGEMGTGDGPLQSGRLQSGGLQPGIPAAPSPAGAGTSAHDRGAAAREAVPPTADPDALTVLRRLVAERAELPTESVGEEHRMSSDLHLSSIAVGQLVVEAARRVGAAPPASPTDYADASVGEIAAVLADRAGGEGAVDAPPGPPAGVDSWVRAFRRRPVRRPLDVRVALPAPDLPAGGFHLLAPDDGPLGELAEELSRALSRQLETVALEQAGVRLVLLPAEPRDEDLRRLLAAAQAAPRGAESGSRVPQRRGLPADGEDPPPSRLVVVHGGGGGGFARSFHLERPGGQVVVVELPAGGTPALPAAELAQRLAAEILGPVPASGYREALYDAAGERYEPRLEVLPVRPEPPGDRASASGAPNSGESGIPRSAAPQAAAADDDPPGSASAPSSGAASTGTDSSGTDSAVRLPLGPEDVLLVTGGGRGIAAECGLDLAVKTGAALALVGRSRRQESRELAENLDRFAAAGVRFRYFHADVTDPAEVAEAVADAERELGPVTAVLHGAGRNRPRRVEALTLDDVGRTVAVKVAGLEHLLAALDPGRLRLLVAFGSIIAEMGVRGEADYALANELLARRVERFAAQHPSCRCHTLEWSVWSGVGMGERLGTLESLMAQGITPIPADRGVDELAALLARPDLPTTVVVSGRFGEPPTVDLDRPELPFLRFLETPRIHVPGVELVVEAEISDASDPYLEDHVFEGDRLFPAVLGLESMLQVATVLAGPAGRDEGCEGESTRRAAVFEDVRFERPVAVPPGERSVLRIAGLVRDDEGVDVVLRSSATAFQVDHFRATVRFQPDTGAAPAAGGTEATPGRPALQAEAGPQVALDPATDLYGGVLFHSGRFRRLAGYHDLRATFAVAEIAPRRPGERWFARHLPGDLLLGDPGARDAVIHGVQASIPHATVLPTAVDRLVPGRLDAGEPYRVEARERSRQGRDLVYDLEVRDREGRVVERWEGLGLRAVADRPAPEAWPLPLLAPHVERRLGDLVPGVRPSVVLAAAPGSEEERRSARDRAVEAASRGLVAAADRSDGVARSRPREEHGGAVVRFRRPDGRRVALPGPDGSRGPGLSVSHGAGLVMAVAGAGPVGCDLEPVVQRETRVWRDLLGSRHPLAEHLSRHAGEDPDSAATRVWCALEALKKLGLPVDAPLTFVAAGPEGWVLLASGQHRVGVLVARVRGVEPALAVAVALPAEAAAADDRLRAS